MIMAREDLRELYQQLIISKIRFAERGEHHLHDIYKAIKDRFSTLCDDSYLCRDNCSQGHNQPEWQHTVRKSLEALKRAGVVSKSDRKNYWILN